MDQYIVKFLKSFAKKLSYISWATSKTFLDFWIFFTKLLVLSYKILSYKKKRVLEEKNENKKGIKQQPKNEYIKKNMKKTRPIPDEHALCFINYHP